MNRHPNRVRLALVTRLRTAARVSIPLLIATCLATGCGPAEAVAGQDAEPDGTARWPIVGGAPATVEQLFATVSILPTSGPFEPFCTGTLVAPTVIVTAAHCMVLGDSAPFYELAVTDVVVAESALVPSDATTEQLHDVTFIAVHEGYDPGAIPGFIGQEDDIAVLVLAGPVTTQSPAPILPLADFDVWVQAETPIVISGFGFRDQAAKDPEQFGALYIAETPFQVRSEFEYVAGKPDSPDSCIGDSGGPGYVAIGDQLAVIGASSRAAEPSVLPCGKGGINTLLPAYEPWLIEQTGGLYQPMVIDPGTGGAGGDDGAGGSKPRRKSQASDDDEGCSVGPLGPSRSASAPQWFWLALGLGLAGAARRSRGGVRRPARSVS